ncbi:hypothetical protein, partial [Methanohalobium sp.]|uniref:hypothetical protein n=1 Tax=Methanohalobium sp. TaxID=2837493 RepID=UPI0025D556C4
MPATDDDISQNPFACKFTTKEYHQVIDGKEVRIGGIVLRRDDSGEWSEQIDPFMGGYPRDEINKQQTNSNPTIYIGWGQDNIGNLKIYGYDLSEWNQHGVMFGKTGFGKSTNIHNILTQFNTYGNNFVFMTPKEDDVLDLLATLPDDELEKTDVVRPGATSPDEVVGYNLFDLTETEKKEYIDDKVDTFVTMMLSQFSQSGARMEPTSRAISRAMMMSDQQFTIADFITVITDQDALDIFINNISEELEMTPSGFEKIKNYEVDDELDPISNRMQQFNDRNALRNMFFQKESDIDFNDYVSGDRNLILDLKETSDKQVFGMLFVRELWLAAKKRGELSSPESFVISVIDEFNTIINEANYEMSNIRDIFSKARAYNFGMFVASQYPDQLPRELVTEVTENTIIKIGLKTEDGYMANYLTDTEIRSVTPNNIKNLERYQSFIQPQDDLDKSAKKLNNFAAYPPRRTMRETITIRDTIVSSIGSPQKNVDASSASIVGENSPQNNNDTVSNERERWIVCRAIDIAQRYVLYNNPDVEQYDEYNKAKYVDYDDVTPILDAWGLEYKYNDLQQFVEQNNILFEQIHTSDGTQLGLSNDGETLANKQDSGSSASGGKENHRGMLTQVREELAKYGVAVQVPEQEGEMSDAL